MYTATNLAGVAGLRHGFFSRRGGVSGGPFEGLNCGYGSDDDRHSVTENRRLALARLGAGNGQLVTVWQTHSNDVVCVDDPWPPSSAPQADAMVTSRPGLVLGILTADCAPVLFADKHAGVIGAAHAGWRGARSGVLEKCVETMLKAGAEANRIRAAVGPCIGQASYRVGPEFLARFVEDNRDNERFFMPAPEPGGALFDLGGYVMGRLAAIGLASHEILGHDTCADAEGFYSYRRGVLAGAPDYGRLLSAIVFMEG